MDVTIWGARDLLRSMTKLFEGFFIFMHLSYLAALAGLYERTRDRALRLQDTLLYNTPMLLGTIWTLTMGHLQYAILPKRVDRGFESVTAAIFFLFLIDWMLNCCFRPKYLFRLFFWLDLFSILSLLTAAPALTRGKFSSDLLERLDTLGYRAAYRKVCAADFGVPQIRHRVIFLAVRKALRNIPTVEQLFPLPTHQAASEDMFGRPYVTVRDAIGDLPPPEPSNRKAALP